jgi:hypothetical protein
VTPRLCDSGNQFDQPLSEMDLNKSDFGFKSTKFANENNSIDLELK